MQNFSVSRGPQCCTPQFLSKICLMGNVDSRITVREIYPEFDRVTVQSHNGEIQHLALAKVSKRISEDVNRMD